MSSEKIESKRKNDNLVKMGEQIKYARLRRRMSVTVVAEKAGVTRASVYSVEAGDPKTSIGIYHNVLTALDMPEEFLRICKDDTVGRELEDSELRIRRRNKGA